MSGFLDANEIEKLFERASEGNLPVDADSRPGRRARWLRTVDFTRPTKFTTDQERRIRRAMDTFIERSATRLVAEHRTAIELEVIDVGQFTWSNAFAQLPDHSVHIQIDTAPHKARMLLSAELPVVLVALERMLGGRPDTASRERELTDIDLMVVQRMFGTIVEALSSVWFEVSETTLEISEVDTQDETVQVASGSEPTLVLTLEARLDGLSSTMALLIPYAAIGAGRLGVLAPRRGVHDARPGRRRGRQRGPQPRRGLAARRGRRHPADARRDPRPGAGRCHPP